MRKKKAEKRPVIPDPRFGDVLIARFINKLMTHGRKATAQVIVYSALDTVAEKTKLDQVEILRKAIGNVAPALEVRSRRVGGATYQVPLEVSPARQVALAMRWIIGYARGRKGQPMFNALANELKDAAQGQGNSVRKRDDVHKQAQANRAFAHFRF